MKTLKELKALYISKLAPDLEILEKERKNIVKKLAYTGVGVITVCLVVFALFSNRAQNQTTLIIIPGMIGLVFWMCLVVGISEHLNSINPENG